MWTLKQSYGRDLSDVNCPQNYSQTFGSLNDRYYSLQVEMYCNTSKQLSTVLPYGLELENVLKLSFACGA